MKLPSINIAAQSIPFQVTTLINCTITRFCKVRVLSLFCRKRMVLF